MAGHAQQVVVVGAGIVGVSTAIWLQRAGYQVTIVDREGFAAGTSFGNAGILAANGVVPVNTPGIMWKAPGMLFSKDGPLFLRWSYLPRLFPFLWKFLANANPAAVARAADGLATLMHDSYEQHVALAKGTGAERYLKPSDYVHLFESKDAFEKDAYGWELRRKHGFKSEELGPEKLGEYDPLLAGKFGYAVRCPDHGQITDPGEYVTALGKHFLELGGQLEIASVTNIKTEAGKAVAIETGDGEIAADQLVIASGVWSRELTRKLGIEVPMESERGYHLEFVNPNMELRSPVMVTSGKFAMNSMEGRLRCGGIVEFAGLDAPPSRAPFELLKRQTKRFFPELEYDEVREWMGHRPSTTDSLPVIGSLPGLPNVWAGFGHQHLGLTGGPKTGRWLAQLIAGERPNVNLDAYAIDRF